MHRAFLLCFLLMFAQSTTLHADVATIEGTVKSIDIAKRTITVEKEGEEKTLDLSSKVKVINDGKDSDLGSLKLGQNVKLSYHDDLEVVLKVQVGNGRELNSPLDGEWAFVEGVVGGKPIVGPIAEGRRIVINGDQYTLSFGDKVIEGRIQFDPNETLKHLNWIPERGGSPAIAGKVQPGICELSNDGTTLRFCVGTPEGIRPTKFDGTPQGWSVQVYQKRAKNGPERETDGFVTLFDGMTLKGWKMLDFPNVHGWEAKDGELVALPLGNVPLLLTEDTFDDFELNCEVLLDAKANSGIYLRGRYELQLIDDGSFPQAGPKNRFGSIVGQLAPSESAYRGPRQWNTLEVRLEGKTVTVVVNGKKVIDERHIEKVTAEAVNDLEKQPGPIALQNRGGLARFRNIKIKRIN